MRIFSILLITLQISGIAHSQQLPGNIMVVGGGSETKGGWSDQPYSWAIEKSENKKVACITFDSSPSSWLPEYFVDLGAVRARNFIINSSSLANSQPTYDSLMAYDVLFLKGGDQWNYYDTYRGTVTEEAITDKFNQGGVICGTSAGLHVLSEVIFTAENGTVYPDEVIADPNNPYVTLADDFLTLMPASIFDSHVAERGRFGRLTGFIANWRMNQDEDIMGIGVDDKTAFCIDRDMTGTVFGTGAVGFYRAGEDNQYHLNGSRLLASDIKVMQLLNACTVDLNTMLPAGLNGYSEPSCDGEIIKGEVYLTGSNSISDNQQFLETFIQSGDASDTIVIITGYQTEMADAFKNKISELGGDALVMPTTPENYDDPGWKKILEDSRKYMFVDNELQVLKDYRDFGSNGAYLFTEIYSGRVSSVFIGGDSRLAGRLSLVNYDVENASYYGQLDFEEGLDILHNTIVMPNTFSEEVSVENTSTGVPYGMILEEIRYGLWLHGNSYAHYFLSEDHIVLHGYGDYPLMFLENKGTATGHASIPPSSGANARNITGFYEFTLELIDFSTPRSFLSIGGINESGPAQTIAVWPNPVNDMLKFDLEDYKTYRAGIFSQLGRMVREISILEGPEVNVKALKPGIYCLRLSSRNNQFITKFIKYE